MALEINSTDGLAYVWNVGMEFRLREFSGKTAHVVRASGQELDYIIANFTNIPTVKAATNTWRGDLAKFITDGLIARRGF